MTQPVRGAHGRVRASVAAAFLICAVVGLAAQGGGAIAGSGGAANSGPVISAVSGGPPPAMPVPRGTGAVSGTVVDALTGAPIGDAFVFLVMMPKPGAPPAPRRSLQQLTDRKGRFVFADVAAADGYTISTRRFAYFDGAFGAEPGSGTGTSLMLAEGDWFSRADIRMWPAGAIAGVLVDEHGDPVVGAYVRVLRQIMIAGRLHLAAGPPVTTDDRGAYRIFGLDPGKYLVCAPMVQASLPAADPFPAELSVDVDASTRVIVGRFPVPPSRAGQAVAYATSCYPDGGSLAQAQPVELRYGADAANIDIRLQPSPVFRVSGRVVGAPEGTARMTLRLLAAGADELGQGSETATALVAADGSFVFGNVPSGDYVIDGRGTTGQFDYQPASAAVAFSDLPRPPVPGSGYSISGSTVTSGPPRTGLRTFSAGNNAQWARMNVSVDGHDVSGVNVRLMPASSISGRIVYEGFTPPGLAPFIVAESADGNPSQSKTRTFRPGDPSDQLLIEGLPPGQYLLHQPSSGLQVIKSIVIAGREMVRKPIDLSGTDVTDIVITITDKPAALQGTVRGSDGTVSADAAVIAFPTDPAAWTNHGMSPDNIRSTVVNNVSGYLVPSLPAGDYFVIAVDSASRTAWQDPAWLAAAAGSATRVAVRWGETRTVDLVRRGQP